MQEELKSIAEKARLEINQAESAEELKAVQVRYLGKKGRITAVCAAWAACRPQNALL